MSKLLQRSLGKRLRQQKKSLGECDHLILRPDKLIDRLCTKIQAAFGHLEEQWMHQKDMRVRKGTGEQETS